MEIDKVRALLIEVKSIIEKYNTVAEITGENFNVFKILGLSTSEVRTHSAFLAELLNPKGSHGMKDVFLKLFLKRLSSYDKEIIDFQTENVQIEVEKWIGNLNKEKNEGGYIDIYIKNTGGQSIIIENKIYASDQEGQLRRYHNFDKDAIIVYLTLKGDETNDFSTKNHEFEKISPICISYRNTIKE